MDMTFTSFLTTLILSSVIVLTIVTLIKNARLNKIVSANIFMGLSIIFIVRLFMPVEFFYTYAIPSRTFLPEINQIMGRQISLFHQTVDIKQLIVFIWILGSSVFFVKWIKKLYGIHLVKCVFKQSIKGAYKKIKVATVDEPISPVVIGLIHPLIVIPNIGLSSSELQYILEHERCHVHSLDLWMKYIYEMLTIVYWWNPVIWFFKKHFNQIIELKADEFVTKKMSKEGKICYVETLVKVGKSVQKQVQLPELCDLPSFSTSNDGLLLERVNHIFNEKKTRNEKLVLLISGILGLYLSSCIIFEPFIEPPKVKQESFSINEDNSFLKQIGDDTYEVHRDGKFLFEITEKQRTTEFKDLKIK